MSFEMTTNKLPPAKAFQDLDVWQKAKKLAVSVYRFTETLPRQEQFGLTLQLRRAAIAVVANIAEGHCRDHQREKIHFFSIARSSAGEVEAEIAVTIELGLGDSVFGATITEQADEVQRMLRGLQQFLSQFSRESVGRRQSHNSQLRTQNSL